MTTTSTPLTIADALRALGTGNGTHKEGNTARVLLETTPLPTLLEALPPLWQREDRKRNQRLRLFFGFNGIYLVALLLTVIAAIFVREASRTGFGPLMYSLSVSFLLPPALGQFFSRLSATQKGIVRLLHLRPCWQMVPLMIDALPLILHAKEGDSSPDTFEERHRALLTRFLPLWCEQDTPDLTPRQRNLLLGQIKRIAREGVGLNRNIGESTPPLSEADADFALALLAALRRPSKHTDGHTLDRKTRAALEHLPHTVRPDDHNRQHLQEAAQALFTQHPS